MPRGPKPAAVAAAATHPLRGVAAAHARPERTAQTSCGPATASAKALADTPESRSCADTVHTPTGASEGVIAPAAQFVPVPDALMVGDHDCDGGKPCVPEAVADGDGSAEPAAGDGDGDAPDDSVAVEVGVGVGVTGDGVTDSVAVGDAVAERDGVAENDGDALPDRDGDGDGDGDLDGVGDGDGVLEKVGDSDGEREKEDDSDGELEKDDDGDGELEKVGDSDGELEKDGDSDGELEKDGDRDAGGDTEAVTDGESDRDGDVVDELDARAIERRLAQTDTYIMTPRKHPRTGMATCAHSECMRKQVARRRDAATSG
jgi:hypothetical protein